ncbi:hypothetical protein HNY73_010132 [Argiope bruennichi]|uniref:Uncharacterized protein n=1 Tax=Argiope bruennichi TaxID=94029 RepID=A0A8T0F054_ARGBR|nr:hypothetical protein HNY73_010132 [Argiope bruennichi]
MMFWRVIDVVWTGVVAVWSSNVGKKTESDILAWSGEGEELDPMADVPPIESASLRMAIFTLMWESVQRRE